MASDAIIVSSSLAGCTKKHNPNYLLVSGEWFGLINILIDKRTDVPRYFDRKGGGAGKKRR